MISVESAFHSAPAFQPSTASLRGLHLARQPAARRALQKSRCAIHAALERDRKLRPDTGSQLAHRGALVKR